MWYVIFQEELRSQRPKYKTPVKAPVSAVMPQAPVPQSQGPPAPGPHIPPGPVMPPQPMNLPPRMPPQPYGGHLTMHVCISIIVFT